MNTETRLTFAIIALATAGGASATVILPNTGASELIFAISENNVISGEADTSFTQDLGFTIDAFDFNSSYSWQLAPGFSIFLDNDRYDAGDCFFNPVMCGADPVAGDGSITPPPGTVAGWQVFAGDSTGDGSSGNQRILSTWGSVNGAAAATNAEVTLAANRLDQAIELQFNSNVTYPDVLNERPGHAGAPNGSDLMKSEDIPPGQFAGFDNYYGLNILGTGATTRFSAINQSTGNAPGMGDTVAMYLFTQSGTDGAAAATVSAVPGTWRIDPQRQWLIYEVAGDPVPNPVPVPGAFWLLGPALVGLRALFRTRA